MRSTKLLSICNAIGQWGYGILILPEDSLNTAPRLFWSFGIPGQNAARLFSRAKESVLFPVLEPTPKPFHNPDSRILFEQ